MICNSCGNSIETFNRFCPKCGAPVQFQTPASGPAQFNSPQPPIYSGPAGPPPRKSSCGKIILILGVILILLLAGIAAAVYFGYGALEKKLKSSEAYTVALQALKENPEVQEKLGEVQDTGFPLGAYTQDSHGSGDAAFSMSVKGSKTTGQYTVELGRSSGVWKIRKGDLRLANGEVIEIGTTDLNTQDNENINTDSDADDLAGIDAPGVVKAGVLNDKAISLPKPPYPPIARQAKATGTVVVRVLIDENGNVIRARPISGHPLLLSAATAAARGAKFPPRKVAGKPVKVSGVINYDFVQP
jgi:TonB family protein